VEAEHARTFLNPPPQTAIVRSVDLTGQVLLNSWSTKQCCYNSWMRQLNTHTDTVLWQCGNVSRWCLSASFILHSSVHSIIHLLEGYSLQALSSSLSLSSNLTSSNHSHLKYTIQSVDSLVNYTLLTVSSLSQHCGIIIRAQQYQLIFAESDFLVLTEINLELITRILEFFY